ncbi:MAG: dihydrofolate reductase [Aquabacterium sp.]|nr:dihydrofolate reductase [Aquabacterium sp.]
MATPSITVIAAVARNGAIGKDNQLLVHLPGDLPRFKRLTLGHPIVMGRKTWDSIGRPLPGRRNIVVTRQPDWAASGAERAAGFDAALALAGDVERVCVIGGAEIYALALPHADELLLTEIDADYDADAHFPDWPRDDFDLVASESNTNDQGLVYRYVTYRRKSGR